MVDLEQIMEEVGEEDLNQLFIDYLHSVNEKQRINNLGKKRFDEIEEAKFVQAMNTSDAYEEQNYIAGKTSSFYIKGIINCLKAVGFDEEYVDEVLYKKLIRKMFAWSYEEQAQLKEMEKLQRPGLFKDNQGAFKGKFNTTVRFND